MNSPTETENAKDWINTQFRNKRVGKVSHLIEGPLSSVGSSPERIRYGEDTEKYSYKLTKKQRKAVFEKIMKRRKIKPRCLQDHVLLKGYSPAKHVQMTPESKGPSLFMTFRN